VKPTPLEDTALFRLLGPARMPKIRPHVRNTRFLEGEHLYYEGGQAEYLYALASGELRTSKSHAGGRVIELERLHPGDLFGLSALNPNASHAESAQGVAAGEAWRVPRRVVQGILAADPAIARGLLAIVAQRLQHAHDRLCSFASDSVTARMARVLLEAPNGERLETKRRILGEAAGTTVETAIRVLRSFERAGWIEGGVGWVRLLDRSALERVAAGESPPSPRGRAV
jgi:CRP/FNR family transcriptional regulator